MRRLVILFAVARALVARPNVRLEARRSVVVSAEPPTEITMPALSSTMTSGRVVSWLKEVGEVVEAGDPVMVIESDKADMEVESFEDGVLAAILVGEGKAGGGPPSTAVTMPALSSTMTSGTIVSWLKGVGDFVEAGDPVMVVESDKADMEVESFDEGYVAAVLVGEGETADVGAVVALLAESEADVAAVAAAAARPAGPVAMTGMQRAIAKNMEATLAVPVFRVSRAVCTDDFDALYRKLKPDGVTVSALLAKACGVALAKTPLMNAAYDAAGSNVVYNARINVAQAVALEGGLITPTLVDADARSLADLSVAWKDLVVRARAGTLKPDEYTSGTFTISNLGMMDVEQFDAILPPGTGAILAVASARPVAVPMAGAALGVGLRKEMVVTVTCDHRIISGADAATFLADFAAAVEAPAGLAK